MNPVRMIPVVQMIKASLGEAGVNNLSYWIFIGVHEDRL